MTLADTLLQLAENIKERIAEGDGIWRTCSGCHDSEDGYDVGYYPFSEVFGCKLGGGCCECGGIGAIWDTTDYEEWGRWMSEQAMRAQAANGDGR